MKKTVNLLTIVMPELSSGWYCNNRIRFIILFLVVFPLLSLYALPEKFSFNKYTSLKSGQSFQIIGATGTSKGKKFGVGKIYQLNPKQMHLQFNARIGLYNVSGNVRLIFLGKTKGKYRVRLDYRGVDNGLPRSSTEFVLVDSFLADRGILTLKFLKGKRFIQMSINRAGKNRFITEWGSAELVKL